MPNYFVPILYGLVLTWMQVVCDKCDQKHRTAAFVGYRCITETERYFIINGLERHHCILECMRRSNCTILNYTILKKTCFIGNDTCVALQPDVEYQTQVFNYIKRDRCVKWISSSDFHVSHPVRTNDCRANRASAPCYVGRIVSPPTYFRAGIKETFGVVRDWYLC